MQAERRVLDYGRLPPDWCRLIRRLHRRDVLPSLQQPSVCGSLRQRRGQNHLAHSQRQYRQWQNRPKCTWAVQDLLHFTMMLDEYFLTGDGLSGPQDNTHRVDRTEFNGGGFESSNFYQ